jgi:hypothetical protein
MQVKRLRKDKAAVEKLHKAAAANHLQKVCNNTSLYCSRGTLGTSAVQMRCTGQQQRTAHNRRAEPRTMRALIRTSAVAYAARAEQSAYRFIALSVERFAALRSFTVHSKPSQSMRSFRAPMTPLPPNRSNSPVCVSSAPRKRIAHSNTNTRTCTQTRLLPSRPIWTGLQRYCVPLTA